MAKSSQTIEELAVSIGLDLDQLRLDFDTAGMTVRQAMSRLNSENTQVKLKADISSLNAAGDAVEQQRIKMQSLTRQVEIQTQKMHLLAAARDSAAQLHGADSGVTRGAETAYLRQQKVVAQLNADLRKLQAEAKAAGNASQQAATKGAVAMQKMSAATAKARSGLSSLTGAYGTLSGKIGAVTAFAVAGGGLFSITDAAMKSGESLYQLSKRLNMTTGEASLFNRTFSVVGADVTSVIPFFARLDKSILSAGASGETTRSTLAQFGVTLTDGAGKLLPMNKQLESLAAGYRKAAEEGKEAEFTAQILGARGAALIPLLEQYETAVEVASGIKTTGILNPAEADKLYKEWLQLKGEAGQLTSTLGAAMMPVASELMPTVKDSLRDIVVYIKDNKQEVTDAIKGWASVLGDLSKVALTTAESVGNLVKVEKDLPWVKSNSETEEVLDSLRGKDDNYKVGRAVNEGLWTAAGAGIGAYFGGGYGALGGAYVGNTIGNYIVNGLGWLAADGDKFDAEKKRIELRKQEQEALKAFQEQQKQLKEEEKQGAAAEQANAAAADANAEAQKRAKDAVEWRSSATGQLTEKIYALTHSDFENAQHQMWVQAEKAQADGLPQNLIDQFVSAQSEKIAEDKFRNVTSPMAQAFKTDLENQLGQIDLQAKSYVKAGATEDEAAAWAAQRKAQINADWDRQVASQIDSLWQTSLQKRLAEIDREKQAWVQKGLDEVKATKWAEESKRQAMQQTAQGMFTSNRKYYDVWKKAGGMGSGQAGVEAILRLMRQEKGIPANAFTTPGELQAFEAAMKAANDNLVPIISDGTYRGVKAAMVEVYRGTAMSMDIPQDTLDSLRGAATSFSEAVTASGTAFNVAVSGAVEVVRGTSAPAMEHGSLPEGMTSRLWTDEEAAAFMQSGGYTRTGGGAWVQEDFQPVAPSAYAGDGLLNGAEMQAYFDAATALRDAAGSLESTVRYAPEMGRPVAQYQPQRRNIRLDINVTGLEDAAADKVKEIAADMIVKDLGDVDFSSGSTSY